MAQRDDPSQHPADPLERYRKKRDPGQTNEPFAERPLSAGRETWAGRFVIHQHGASRMHFDLRLEIGVSLMSFAVPKGPTLDPAEKRLAVNTENHPSAYLDFEDVIPEGNYGAGPMIVWDTGSVRYLETSAEAGIERGKIDFELYGFKMRGRFGLIHTGKRKAQKGGKPQPEWLLVKKPDAFAKDKDAAVEPSDRSVLSGLTVTELLDKGAVVAAILEEADALGARRLPPGHAALDEAPPMICALEGAPLASPDWIYELKLDGVRIVATKEGESARLRYRSGRSTSASYPEITRALRALAPHHAVIDGEIVTFDERGRPSFERLVPRIAARGHHDVELARAEIPVAMLCFDLLALEDRDLRGLPLVERKRLLARLIRGVGYLRLLDHIVGRGDALFALAEKEELEGVVAKRARSVYRHGPQVTSDWVKLKRTRDEEFVVVGFTEGKGARKKLGALLLATYRGDELVYRGLVGTGLDGAQLRFFEQKLAELEVDAPSALEVPTLELPPVRWTRPELVVRVRFTDFTESGHLRTPTFVSLVPDRAARDCTAAPSEERRELETRAASPDPPPPDEGARRAHSPAARSPTAATRPGLTLSNLNKVFWPEEGYTKGDLLEYYAAVGDWLLPFLRARPVVLVRYPDGIQGKSFYQWRAPEGTPGWLRTFELYDEEKQEARGAGKAAFLLDDPESLLYVINLGCIPLHVLACREGRRDRCDFLTIDFDLGPRPFKDAVTLALSLRSILEELGLVGFPKTSGQRGLHVLVPLGEDTGFPTAKILCELLGRLIVARHPELSTMERRKEKRGDKVFVDTGQTGQSRTIVAPYSARAHEGATVSTPLSWNELHLALDPRAFTITSVPARLRSQRDPWEGFFTTPVDVPALLATLARWTGRG